MIKLNTPRVQSPLFSRPVVTAERVIAVAAVAITAFGFAQPQIMALAGLDFEKQHIATRSTDPSPTGSITPQAKPVVHGLSGTLLPLRSPRD